MQFSNLHKSIIFYCIQYLYMLLPLFTETLQKLIDKVPILLTWITFNPRMDK